MHAKDNIYLSPVHRLHSVSESQQYSVMRDFGSCGVLRTSYILSSHTHLIPHTTTTDQLPSGKHGPHFDWWQFLMFINTIMACFYCSFSQTLHGDNYLYNSKQKKSNSCHCNLLGCVSLNTKILVFDM